MRENEKGFELRLMMKDCATMKKRYEARTVPVSLFKLFGEETRKNRDTRKMEEKITVVKASQLRTKKELGAHLPGGSLLGYS